MAKWAEGWSGGLPETPCGNGSTVQMTKQSRPWLDGNIVRHGIRTVIDVGCGDLNWQPLLKAYETCEWIPLDIYPRLESVRQFDITQDQLPQCDEHTLILCVWVMNHLTPDQQRQARTNIIESGAGYLVHTVTGRQVWQPMATDAVRVGKYQWEWCPLLHDGVGIF